MASVNISLSSLFHVDPVSIVTIWFILLFKSRIILSAAFCHIHFTCFKLSVSQLTMADFKTSSGRFRISNAVFGPTQFTQINISKKSSASFSKNQ